jgi:hypothetical protein
MDGTSLMLSMLFGTIGMAFLMYARQAGRLLPVAAGVGLMVLPYFISSVAVLLVACSALTAVPFLFRDA